jgi:hypothetical protein
VGCFERHFSPRVVQDGDFGQDGELDEVCGG